MNVQSNPNKSGNDAITQAIKIAGSQKKLAQSIQVTQQTIAVWLKKGCVPLHRIDAVSKATGVSSQLLLDALLESANLPKTEQ